MNVQFTFLQAATSLAFVAWIGLATAAQADIFTGGSIEQAAVSGKDHAVPAGPSAQRGLAQNRHCVMRLEPAIEGQKVPAAKYVGCYPTFAAATYAGTNGTVSLPPDATPDSLKESDLAASAYTLIGVDFEKPFLVGTSLSWYASNSHGCRGGLRYALSSMPPSLDNKISSTASYGGCDFTVNFDLPNFLGENIACYRACAHMCDMDNRTSSKIWR